MAIINASDLLVYKKSPADVQEQTLITVSANAVTTSGTVNLLGVRNSGGGLLGGTGIYEITLSDTATEFTTVSSIRNALILFGYTATAVEFGGGEAWFTATNIASGDIDPSLSYEAVTAVLDNSKIEFVVTTSGETLNTYEPIAHSTSASVSFNMDLRDTTTKDSGGFQDNEGGLRSFELSTDALQDVNADLDFKEFFDDINSRSEVTVRFAERGSGQKWEGVGIVTSASMDAGVEENTTYSVSITGTGVATQDVY